MTRVLPSMTNVPLKLVTVSPENTLESRQHSEATPINNIATQWKKPMVRKVLPSLVQVPVAASEIGSHHSQASHTEAIAMAWETATMRVFSPSLATVPAAVREKSKFHSEGIPMKQIT